MLLKVPPITMWPSDWMAALEIVPFAPALSPVVRKELLKVPFAFSTAMRLALLEPVAMAVNAPTTRMLSVG